MKIKTQQFQNLWDTAKAVLKGMFTDIKTYLRKQEKSQTCYWIFFFTN